MDRVNSVQELLDRAAERNMPLERMRFFINEDRKEPRCFGIYQDQFTGHWVVYKNKADGSRAVRYSGPDEAYAAQEIWAKSNSEIELRRARARPARRSPEAIRREKIKNGLIALLVAAAIGYGAYMAAKEPRRGYYVYNDDVLYYQNSAWYYFDDYYDDWSYYDEPEGDDWYQDAYYGSSYPFEDSDYAFDNSEYYREPDSDSDSDSSIFDSWDSSDTDWSSDW